MSIKLKGSSDGSVSFDAPADTSPSGSDITLTLPTSAGSANQFLKNSGIAGELEYSSMVETSSGVGIGASSPTSVLHVKSDTANDVNNGILFEAAASTNKVFRLIENSTGEAYSEWFNADTSKVRIRANGDSYFNGGNVGINHSSPQFGLTLGQSANDIGKIGWEDAGSQKRASITCSTSTDALQFHTGTSDSERMRIDSNGTQHNYRPAAGTVIISRTGQSGFSASTFRGYESASSITTGTVSFVVYANGNVQNKNNSYGQISDIKLKENIVDANSQWDDLKAFRIRNWNFKPETGYATHTQIGVVAQEVEAVSPGLVYETPDRDDEGVDLGTVTKGVNYSVLYMKAVKALQEAQTRIETLESQHADLLARVTALEAA